MTITASKLRQDVYRILDEALETGVPVEIERNGRRLRIIPDQPTTRLERLVRRPEAVVGDVADLVDVDFAASWNP